MPGLREASESPVAEKPNQGEAEQRTDVFAEYLADVNGGRVRLVLTGSDGTRSGEWQPVACGLAPFRFTTPIQDIEWSPSGARMRVPGWTRWIAVPSTG